MRRTFTRTGLSVVGGAAVLAAALTAPATLAQDQVELKLLIDDNEATVTRMQGMVDAQLVTADHC